MILPKYFTCYDVLEALYRKKDNLRLELAMAQNDLVKCTAPAMTKTWFGYYKNQKPEWKVLWDAQDKVKEIKTELAEVSRMELVLNKFWEQSKVGLNEEEVLWFGDTLYKRNV